jgi:hypothetical protein
VSARHRARLIAALLALVVAGLVLGACGGGRADVSEPAGLLLHAQVDALRQTALDANRAEARHQLTELESSVRKLRATGDLSAGAAADIRRAASEVEAQLVLIPLPTTTTTTTAPPPEPAVGPGPGPRDHRGRGRGPRPGDPRGD